MINEVLLDPKDREICRLKLQIEKFKKYDEERKKYYHSSLIELEQLKDAIQEFNSCRNHPFRKIRNLKSEVKRLKLIVEYSKLKDTHDTNTLIRYSLELKNRELQKQISCLTKELQRLRTENGELIGRIYSLQNKN